MSDDLQRVSPDVGEEPGFPTLSHPPPPHLVTDYAPGESKSMRKSLVEEVFQSMINSIPQLIWRANPQGAIDYLSDQWYDFTGVHRPHSQRIISLHEDWQSVIHADEREAYLAAWNTSVKSQKPFQSECRILRAGNGYCWHLCRANPVRDKFGRVLSWYGTSTYVHEFKHERDDLVAASQAKDRFLAMLAHELRTPLTPALLIIAELEASAPTHLLDCVHILRRNIEREIQLVGDVFDLSAARNGKLAMRCEVVDMRDIVTSALEICRPELDEKNIAVTLSWAAQSTKIVADPARMQQVIWNLLRNATKFTATGGKVEIGSVDTTGQLLRLWVKDNGIGIAPHAMERLFEPFEQGEAPASSRSGGLGLGLAIARDITTLHQGNLFAISDGLGHGSTFVLEVPVLPRQNIPDPPIAARPEATSATPAALSILLVEDHPDTVRALHRLLLSFGHEVTSVLNAADAIASARANDFDLIICDVSLPDQSGWDFLRGLRAFSKAPAIAMTGFGSVDDIARSHAAGFGDHLVKPVSIATLRASIAATLLQSGTSAR